MSNDKRADELHRACNSRPTDPELERIHSYATCNRFAYGGSALAGCFYCCEIWEPAGMKVTRFCDVDDEAPDELGNATILCHVCSSWVSFSYQIVPFRISYEFKVSTKDSISIPT